MTIRITRVSMTAPDGEIDEIAFAKNATEVVGPRNSGKTTYLRVVDYCLGNDDSAAAALGADVAGRYDVYRLDLELAGTPHQIERRPNEYGYAGRIFVDGTEILQSEFSDWILLRLGWPAIRIPKARDPRNATSTVPLTFRTLLRHLYRREDSWSDFAYREEEFHRRAVLRFFLGALDVEGDLGEFAAAEAERRVADLRARLEDAIRDGEETLRGMSRTLGVDVQAWDQLTAVLDDLTGQIRVRSNERQRITDDVTAAQEYQGALGDEYASLSRGVTELRRTESDLEGTLRAFRDGSGLVRGEIERLERARTAIGLFEDIPVRQCPACGQDVSARDAVEGHCFLCSQPVTDDLRKRRIEIEQRALAEELAEIEEQIAKTSDELQSVRDDREAGEARRVAIGARIEDERAALLAPHVVRLEQLSAEIASLQQSQAALRGLSVLEQRVSQRRAALLAAEDELSRIERLNVERADNLERVAARCAAFSADMTEYLGRLREDPWRFGEIFLRPEDMAFFVGDKPWRERLGGESKVVFLLAYHYAILRLSGRADSGVRPPGVAIFDNPIQQGVPDGVVAEALEVLEATAVAMDACLITTLARRLNTAATGKRVHALGVQYGADAEGSAE